MALLVSEKIEQIKMKLTNKISTLINKHIKRKRKELKDFPIHSLISGEQLKKLQNFFKKRMIFLTVFAAFPETKQ